MPIGLTRHRTSKLLGTVNGKPHATQADHADALPTPPPSSNATASALVGRRELTDEEIRKTPVTDDDDGEESHDIKPQRLIIREAGSGVKGKGAKMSRFRKPEVPLKHASSPARKFQLPATASPSGSKRSVDDDGGGGSDSDGEVFSGSSQMRASQKRQKTYGGKSENIHAPRTSVKAGAKKQKIFKKAGGKAVYAHKNQFKPPQNHIEVAAIQKPKASFRRPEGIDLFEFGQAHDGDDLPDAAEGGLSDSSLSPPAASSDVEELDKYDPLRIDCSICGERVPKVLKERYKDEVMHGQKMDFKWQQRFCQHHRADTARETWQERRYPDIDWKNLSNRLAEHNDHLLDVLASKVPSSFARSMAERVQKRRRSGKPGGIVGYYGPRGEKIMVDHILADLDEDLRLHAAGSDLVTTRGTAGGVTGLVTTVLASELALQLIKQDLNMDDEGAKVVIAESEELGELLHPEIEERVELDDELDGDASQWH
ncbi:hypothetical protein K431DRAFT_288556 [Polychaeton citri CBS 116435]|uniref:Restriction of telomere capping protein 4 n=1 Tax=Polychaeton citri CBS 116435 TaxID=1314669 RepID=A0A9P4UJ00_9PEZI|nr:hypothetical protein K431DRAFT_288556 [Polychaeton citri CBS 116435]